MWNLSPMNAQNNVNGIGTMPRGEVYTLKHKEMVDLHDSVTTRIVAELRDAPNIYYEICNEPYFGGVTPEWQQHISETIVKAEASFPHKHLIAQNIANDWAKITSPNPNVSIFNFHYASPPRAVAENYALNRPIAFDETGFKGSEDFTYRAQAWEFLLAGGSVFSNLDYSFTIAKPDGTMPVAPPTPGGGSPAYRNQLGILKRFMDSLDFIHMTPDTTAVKSIQPTGIAVHALSSPGKSYAAYFRGDGATSVGIELPPGSYESEWMDTRTGEVSGKQAFKHGGGIRSLTVPGYTQDIALRIRRK